MPTVNLSPTPILQFFNNLGQPNVGGTVLTQIGGINTAAYEDVAGIIPLPNPIVLNSRGEVANAQGLSRQLYLQNTGLYTLTVSDSLGNLIGTYQVTGAPGSTSSIITTKAPTREAQVATAGQTIFTLTTTAYQINSNNIAIFVNGLKLPSTDFVETSSVVITLIVGLLALDEIEFVIGGQTNTLQTAPIVYTYPGTGAVARTLQTKANDWASIDDWGAVGDGVTDDTAAFQTAINWMQSNSASHMELRLAAKAYRILGTITCTGAVRISGEGYQNFEISRPITRPAKGSWLIHASSTGPLFMMTGNFGLGSFLSDFAIFEEGHPAPGPGWAPASRDWCIRNEGTQGTLRISRLHFHNVYRGINTYNSARPQYEDITGQFFYRALSFDQIYDLGKFEGLHAWTFWSQDNSVLQYTQANSIALTLLRVDGLWVDRIFSFATNITVYCGSSVSGSAKVIYMGGIYSDFCGRGIVVDAVGTYITVDTLFHLGQVWPSAPVLAMTGACGFHLASGNNSLVQITNFHDTLSESAAVKVQGTNNQVWITSVIADQTDKSNVGAAAFLVDSTNTLYTGPGLNLTTALGAIPPRMSGAGVLRAAVEQQFVTGQTKNNFYTAGSATGQLVTLTVEGDAAAGLAVIAKSTGIVSVGASANALSFYGGASATKPTVTGAKGGNAALTSLLAALASMGLITDSST